MALIEVCGHSEQGRGSITNSKRNAYTKDSKLIWKDKGSWALFKVDFI